MGKEGQQKDDRRYWNTRNNTASFYLLSPSNHQRPPSTKGSRSRAELEKRLLLAIRVNLSATHQLSRLSLAPHVSRANSPSVNVQPSLKGPQGPGQREFHSPPLEKTDILVVSCCSQTLFTLLPFHPPTSIFLSHVSAGCTPGSNSCIPFSSLILMKRPRQGDTTLFYQSSSDRIALVRPLFSCPPILAFSVF